MAKEKITRMEDKMKKIFLVGILMISGLLLFAGVFRANRVIGSNILLTPTPNKADSAYSNYFRLDGADEIGFWAQIKDSVGAGINVIVKLCYKIYMTGIDAYCDSIATITDNGLNYISISQGIKLATYGRLLFIAFNNDNADTLVIRPTYLFTR